MTVEKWGSKSPGGGGAQRAGKDAWPANSDLTRGFKGEEAADSCTAPLCGQEVHQQQRLQNVRALKYMRNGACQLE